VTVTFVTCLDVPSIVFVRGLSNKLNEACETLKITFSHLIVVSIIDINIGVF